MPYTLVITSCDRHDLLKQTLDSFIEAVDQFPTYTIIVEDSSVSRPGWLSEPKYRQLGQLTWLDNGVRMGQVYSLDRAYSEIKTEYAVHLEDDWLFEEGNFIGRSFEILKTYPQIIQVSWRGSDANGHPLIDDGQYPFKLQEPYWGGYWGGWSWNPCLLRVKQAQELVMPRIRRRLGQHGLGFEAEVSKHLLDAGFRIAVLPAPTGRKPYSPYVRHLGSNRSKAIEKLPDLPRVLIAIPACHNLDYGKWESEDSPKYNPSNKAYGKDIHISARGNQRIQAVKDTWARDVRDFKSVDLRFFYGLPHSRKLEDDEVYLNVKDDYESLPFKTIAICRWALEKGYDYLFKCDDDTFVWVDRLMKELMEDPRLDYGGYEHAGVCTGGPGYILSKRAMKIIADSSPTHWAEDCHVGITLTNQRINVTMLPNHRPGFSAHWYDISNIPPGTVTIHAVKPTDMRVLYDRERKA